MGKKEFRLRNAVEQLSEPEQDMLKREVEKLFSEFSTSHAEAAFMGKLIYLPDAEGIEDPSNIKIIPLKKTKIDYIASLEHNQLREHLTELQKRYDLN